MNYTITFNGEPRSLTQNPLILKELLSQLETTAQGYAVALNGKVIPRAHWATQPVTIGDSLLLIYPIAGG